MTATTGKNTTPNKEPWTDLDIPMTPERAAFEALPLAERKRRVDQLLKTVREAFADMTPEEAVAYLREERGHEN